MTRGAAVTGVVVLLAASWTPALWHGAFTYHMLAHVVAVAVAAPLLAWTVPWPRRLSWPPLALVACGIELVVVWGWHLPPLHRLAAESVAVFVTEQLSFLAAGVLLWGSVQPAAAERRRPANLLGVGVLLMTSMHMTLLGALLILAPRALYHEGSGHHDLMDQQLGGLVMLIACSTVYLGAAVTMLRQMLRPGHAASRVGP